MFKPKRYVPILRGKLGEYHALRGLAPEVRDLLTPVIAIPQIPWNWTEDTPAKTLTEHLAPVPNLLQSCGFADQPFFLDLDMAMDSEDPSRNKVVDDEHALVWLTAEAAEAAERGVRLVPVTGLDRPDDYQAAVGAVAARDDLGACIRLDLDFFDDPDVLIDELARLRGRIGVDPSESDLIVDFKDIRQTISQVALLRRIAVDILSALPEADAWRSVTLTGSSFPATLSDMAAESVTPLGRVEYRLWEDVLRRPSRIRRLPAFGDYGVSSAEPSEEVDPRWMRMSANLRYTTHDRWLIFKGRNVRDHGYEQFRELCADLVQRPEFSGRDFSSADGYIDDCAVGNVPHGNATTWRRLGTNHHLTLVARQIASRSDP